MSDDQLKQRLDNLEWMLEEKGLYVKSNTVFLVKKYIEELEKQNASLEAKLADASIALKQALDSLSFAAHELAAQAHIPEEDSEMLQDRISLVVTTIAKIKGK